MTNSDEIKPNSEAAHKFKPFPLELIKPSFDSELTSLILELEHLRKKSPAGSTPAPIFFQVKNIFHMLESVGSARIEGNRTTILEYIEKKLEADPDPKEPFREIQNMEKAHQFIDDHIQDTPQLSRALLSEVHKIVVDALVKEGSRWPGEYRKANVVINRSEHVPPPFERVPSYMDELFEFINHEDAEKYDLIKAALAHHRFVWVHPYDNGNGRTVRLFTYAMLMKLGFQVHRARIVNPTAIFCHDRRKYFERLAGADNGSEEGLTAWTTYMLSGLKREIEKIDQLSDFNYLGEKILSPAIDMSRERQIITDTEFKILKMAIDQREGIANSDVKKTLFPGKHITDISRQLKNIRDKKMLVPSPDNQRKYILSFDNNFLLRGIMASLDKQGFLPVNEQN